MKKILEKRLEGLTMILASDEKGNLFMGSQTDYESGCMTRLRDMSNLWCEVDMELVHLSRAEDGVYCNVGIGLPVRNDEFPHLLFAFDELPLSCRV